MRHILHADLDAFYASVEQRDDPALRGKPVVVGGSPEGRGVVAAASYEVRRFGVRSAMPMKTALSLCPQAIRVQPRFDVYGQVSRQVMDIFRRVTPLIEPLSLDEAYLDVTDSVTGDRSPEDMAADIRRWVADELGLTVSVGVATSKSVAKIASDMNKPDGLTVVPPRTEREFLAPLPAARMSGVGPKTSERLAAEGVRTIGDLAAKPEEWFAARLGKVGSYLRRLALGLDDRAVVVEREPKSVSAETTLAHDSDDPELLMDPGREAQPPGRRTPGGVRPRGANGQAEAQARRLHHLHSPGDAGRARSFGGCADRGGWVACSRGDGSGKTLQARRSGCFGLRSPRGGRRPPATARRLRLTTEVS